jgi:hypothetical protein
MHGDGTDIQLSRLCTQIAMHIEEVVNHSKAHANFDLWPSLSQLSIIKCVLWNLRDRLSQAGFAVAPSLIIEHGKKLRILSPRRNYTDLATAACRRS